MSTRSLLRSEKAFSHAGVHSAMSGASLFVRSDKGTAIELKFGMKFL